MPIDKPVCESYRIAYDNYSSSMQLIFELWQTRGEQAAREEARRWMEAFATSEGRAALRQSAQQPAELHQIVRTALINPTVLKQLRDRVKVSHSCDCLYIVPVSCGDEDDAVDFAARNQHDDRHGTTFFLFSLHEP